MRKFKKYIKPVLIGLGVLILILVAGIILYAKIYLTAQVVENTLSRNVQQQLHRQVAFREIEISFLKGIVLRGVTISRSLAWETDDFFTCEEIAMDYGFWPLLFKKFVIRSLTLKNPHLNLQSSGSRPFSLYGNARLQAKAGPELELLLVPGSVLVHGGAARIIDTKENIGFELVNITVDAGGISYILPFDVSAHASFSGSSTEDVKLTGACFIPGQEFSAELSVPDAELGRFRIFFALAGIPLQKGSASINLTVKGKGENPAELSGKISLKDAEIELLPAQKGDDEISLRGLSAELNMQADYDPAVATLAIKKIHGALLNSPFEGSGSIREAGPNTSVQLHIAADRLSLDELSEKVSYGLLSPFKGLRLAGLIGLRIDMSQGREQFPIITLNLRGNRILYPALGSVYPELSGTLTFDSKDITLSDLRLGTRSLGIVLAGKLLNYLFWPPQADIRVVSSDFNFYEIFNSPESQQGEDIGPFDFGALKFDGPLELGDISFLNFDLGGVQGSYVFENNRFSIVDFKGGIKPAGSFNLAASVNLAVKGFEYNLKLSLFDVPVQQVGELAGADLSRFMDGFVTGATVVSARGTKSTTFADSLAGDGSYKIKNCRIRGFAMPEQLDRFIRPDSIKELNFTDADLQLKLRGSAIEVTGAFISPKLELHPSGQIGLDMAVDMQAQLNLAPEVFSSETKVAEYLPRDGSWVALPLVIKGTMDNPSITLTEDALRHIMQETLPRLFMDMLEQSKQRNSGAEAE